MFEVPSPIQNPLNPDPTSRNSHTHTIYPPNLDIKNLYEGIIRDVCLYVSSKVEQLKPDSTLSPEQESALFGVAAVMTSAAADSLNNRMDTYTLDKLDLVDERGVMRSISRLTHAASLLSDVDLPFLPKNADVEEMGKVLSNCHKQILSSFDRAKKENQVLGIIVVRESANISRLLGRVPEPFIAHGADSKIIEYFREAVSLVSVY